MKSAAFLMWSRYSAASGAAELPGEHDRERHLVELEVAPVRRAVDGRVLRERAVRLLLAEEEVVHRAVGAGACRRPRSARWRSGRGRATRRGGRRPTGSRAPCPTPTASSARRCSRRGRSCPRARRASSPRRCRASRRRSRAAASARRGSECQPRLVRGARRGEAARRASASPRQRGRGVRVAEAERHGQALAARQAGERGARGLNEVAAARPCSTCARSAGEPATALATGCPCRSRGARRRLGSRHVVLVVVAERRVVQQVEPQLLPVRDSNRTSISSTFRAGSVT